MQRLPTMVLLLAAVFASGCSRPLAEMMTSTPNRFNPMADVEKPWPSAEEMAGADQTFTVKVGPPDAKLSVSIVEPDADFMAEHGQAKGTVLVLHGIFVRSVWMMPQAKMLSDAGYRAVLVDLRGHGRSSGARMTFGVQEAKDLGQVIDELQRRQLVDGNIGVCGVSYGGATSIHLAGHDPRIKAVVAVAPFSTVRDEIPHFGRVMVPGAGWIVPETLFQDAVDEAGRLAEFDPDQDTTVEAIRRTEARVLLVHGTGDLVVPHKHSVRLHEAAPEKSELVSVPWVGHVVIWVDPMGDVATKTRNWFDRWLWKDD